MTTQEIREMSDEELQEWGDSAAYCGGVDAERYKIECYRRRKK